jgi:hypothetical protein
VRVGSKASRRSTEGANTQRWEKVCVCVCVCVANTKNRAILKRPNGCIGKIEWVKFRRCRKITYSTLDFW